MATRLDAWVNHLTGLGDKLRDAIMSTRQEAGERWALPELDTLFHDDYLAHKICTRAPRDALRRWVELRIEDEEQEQSPEPAKPTRKVPTLTGIGKASEGAELGAVVEADDDAQAGEVEGEEGYEDDDITVDDESPDTKELAESILDALDELCIRQRLFEAAVWARQAGGAIIVLGLDDGQESDQPLNEDNIRSLRFLNVLRPDMIRADRYYTDPMSPKFGEVELWSASNGSGRMLHESRVVQLRGELTTDRRRKENGGWDVSVLQRALGPLQRNAQSWPALAHLLTKSNLLTFGLKDFASLVKGMPGAREAFATRMQMQKMGASVNSWIAHDADMESVQNISVNMSGIPEAMDRLMMEVAAASDMPVTVAWGRSPAGMNATGDSDWQNWYDYVAGYREERLLPPLKRIVRLMMLSAEGPCAGVEPDSWDLRFHPLREPSDKERAEIQVMLSSVISVLIQQGVAEPEEIALSLFGPDGPFSNIQLDLDARREMAKATMDRLLEEAKNPPPPPTFGPVDPNNPNNPDNPPDPNNPTDDTQQAPKKKLPPGGNRGG